MKTRQLLEALQSADESCVVHVPALPLSSGLFICDSSLPEELNSLLLTDVTRIDVERDLVHVTVNASTASDPQDCATVADILEVAVVPARLYIEADGQTCDVFGENMYRVLAQDVLLLPVTAVTAADHYSINVYAGM